MGLEIFEEFRPITPIRTVPIARTFNQYLTDPSDPQVTKELLQLNVEQDQECHTPKSPSHTLKTPLVCPPAPKKPRLARRNVAPPPQGYFQVPHDLASIFILHKPSKKIRATS
ncbi:hypothetical protein L6164_013985 [Bauhinia variegata]|uniref:Uncharacterized protein n=1 Tax=Bauhinia variegata TaxID=167791 RepID=A0ACB9NKQ5_BAUVA|nr:hypothetical protein L6164_013985 [Bauhinia variegata]